MFYLFNKQIYSYRQVLSYSPAKFYSPSNSGFFTSLKLSANTFRLDFEPNLKFVSVSSSWLYFVSSTVEEQQSKEARRNP